MVDLGRNLSALESQDCNERFTVSAVTLSHLDLAAEVLGPFIEGAAFIVSRHLLCEATASNHPRLVCALPTYYV